MKILSWNVHGMVGAIKRCQVNEVLWHSKSDFCCLQKHRMGIFETGLLKLMHPTMDYFHTINRMGAGDSIILVRKEWCAKLAFSHAEGHAIVVQIERQGLTWLVISIYAPNVPAERKELWGWLQNKIMGRDTIMRGDFNRGRH